MLSPGAAVGCAMALCLVVGYIVGAYFTREYMLKRIESEVADAIHRHEAKLLLPGDRPEHTETAS